MRAGEGSGARLVVCRVLRSEAAAAIEQSVDLIAQLQGTGGRSQVGQGGPALRVEGGGRGQVTSRDGAAQRVAPGRAAAS